MVYYFFSKMTAKILLDCFVLMCMGFVSSNFCYASLSSSELPKVDLSDLPRKIKVITPSPDSSELSSAELTDSSRRIKEVRDKEDERFESDVSELQDMADSDSLRKAAIKHRMDLRVSRLDYFDLSTEHFNLVKEVKLLEKILCYLKIKMSTIKEIENYETDLDTYEFNNTNITYVFQPDIQLINNQPSLHARQEEYRRQRWSFYLDLCPTEKMQKLRHTIDKYGKIFEKIDFSTAIAKLHRKISTELREGANRLKQFPQDYRLCLDGEEYKAIPVILKRLHLDTELKKEIDYQFSLRPNKTNILGESI